jgi:hypothetical protein
MPTSPKPSKSPIAIGVWRLLAQRDTFTAEEVRQRLLSADTTHSRTTAVHAAAARTALWTSRLPEKAARDLGRAASRLPTVVYWYRQGVPASEIGRRLSPFGGAWDADRALEVAAVLITEVLNGREVADLAA